jgi:hypothetical protein
MQLKSFGCSFIFGTDLLDIKYKEQNPSNHTWPALLAKHLGYYYKCYARPGSGNLQIAEHILNQVADSNTTDLFVIGWTWIDRFDYIDINKKWNPWSTIMPVDNTELAKIYYRDLHSEYRDKLNSLIYIKLSIDTLKQKGIPFIMTYMDKLMFEQRWHITPAVKHLQEYIQPHMTTFNEQTFLEWSRANCFPESALWHPLEDAHRSAADYMIKVFDKQNTIDR